MSKELRAERRRIRQDKEAKERIRSHSNDFCVRSLKTSEFKPCANQRKPARHPKSCQNCLGFSNFEE